MSAIASDPISKSLKARDIRLALRRHFPADRCAIVYEVAAGTGSYARRHLDAVAMELWPSHGLALHGIEIKASVYDWRRELANPAKAEEIAQYCDYFWLAAPKGIIPVEELPSAWGLIEVGADGEPSVTKKAERTEAKPVTRLVLAAMLRAAARGIGEDSAEAILNKRLRAMEADFERRLQDRAKFIASERSRAAENWHALVAALGHDPDRFYEDSKLIGAVAAVLTAGVAASWNGLHALRRQLETMLTDVRQATKDMAIPAEGAAESEKRRGDVNMSAIAPRLPLARLGLADQRMPLDRAGRPRRQRPHLAGSVEQPLGEGADANPFVLIFLCPAAVARHRCWQASCRALRRCEQIPTHEQVPPSVATDIATGERTCAEAEIAT